MGGVAYPLQSPLVARRSAGRHRSSLDVLLGAPVTAAGPIVPDPLDDPRDFLTLALPGYAEASFLTFGMEPDVHITSNGVFFPFDVTCSPAGYPDDVTLAVEHSPAGRATRAFFVAVSPGKEYACYEKGKWRKHRKQ